MRILLVEDDPMIGAEIQAALMDASYAVDWVRSGQTALDSLPLQEYDLMLLDLGLPEIDGLGVLKRVRADGSPVALIIISARDSVEDRIAGLDAGADDYIVKPFEVSELMARMRAVVRRKDGDAAPLLENGQITLNPATREACVNSGPPISLSKREYALFHALMVRPGAILSRAELEDRIYGWGEEVESNAVEFLIHALRRKLGTETIRNVRGVGWMVSKHA